MTSIKRIIHNQDLNKGFSKEDRNIYDYAVDIVNPATYAHAINNTASNLIHPINTAKTLGKATINAVTNLSDNINVFNDESNDKALGMIGDAALVAGIPSLAKNTLGIIDKNFTTIGKNLERIRYEGEANNLTPWEISKNQMKEVGITSNQRQAYRPIVSDLAEKYITPYSYEGLNNQNKVQQTISNIRNKNIKFNEPNSLLDRTSVTPERQDAFSLYLGKPQKNNTFRVADTSPSNHPSYSPEKLQNMDIYSINEGLGTFDIESLKHYRNPSGALVSPRRVENYMNVLRKDISVDRGNEIMGGYNKRLNNYGMEYNDIWDLEPSIVPVNRIPRQFKNKFDDNPIFYKKSGENSYRPRSLKFNVKNILGKPFMSHGLLTETTIQSHSNNLSNMVNAGIEYNTEQNLQGFIGKLQDYNKEIKSLSTKKTQGWLNQYN